MGASFSEEIKTAAERLKSYDGPKVRIMEVCGTHTHEIFRLGIRGMLSENIELISGPGCPVCVTPVSFIDSAIRLAAEQHVTVASFGDLLRVPGSKSSLSGARAMGADILPVYSPRDAAKYAEENPEKEVVFLAAGFETTAPANCLAVRYAAEKGLSNFSILSAMKTMPAAYDAMADSTDVFLYPGHVCAVTGTADCEAMLEKGVSGVVSGFSAEELITALFTAVFEFGKGQPFFRNCYTRVVKPEGQPEAKMIVSEMLMPCDSMWRGIGVLPSSGLLLSEKYERFDASKRYEIPEAKEEGNPACRCGDVLHGVIKPDECPLFGKVCTPDDPVGACMVSSEGTCSAWYQYSI